MNTPDHTPTYLAICQSVRADAFILGIEPSDESEHARDKAKELIARQCKQHLQLLPPDAIGATGQDEGGGS